MEVGMILGSWEDVVSREQLVRYAGASGDFNPIHYDDQAAKGFGLPGVIVHGMLNMGMLAQRLISVLPAGSRLAHYGARFRSMVEPGQPLTLMARVRSCEGTTLTVDVDLRVTGASSPAVTGRATVELPAS